MIKEELELLLKHDQLASNPYLPILFCANKMDLKDALSSMKIVEHLGLNQIGERPWHIQVGARQKNLSKIYGPLKLNHSFFFQATNALTGEGLPESLQWLVDQLVQTKK